MAAKSSRKETGIMLVYSFFVLFLVNSIVLWFANTLFPNYVVLGTQYISKAWAVIHSMGILALIGTLAVPVIREFENSRGKMFTNKDWMLAYLVINFVGVWVVARFADDLGFGIPSFFVAGVLAIVLDVLQGAAMMQLEKLRKK